ncbi:short chain dehydrogenase family protein [Hypoxylon fragiforme]|uniref:short chain dehydrogenase family protein n=1 Tax=Hypoxylon fragiforme TaxID=63214 RepID=UPI0020C5C35B|nr:short chain dehydrogenase family protein [Hypoxylon fragiforme]KAI2612920.1 short chain dehydrogenase family protein [Hypoxylon fragiforme]
MDNNTKVAIVVGASRGMGRQIAIDLAKNGYAVVVAAKSTGNNAPSTAPFPPDPNSAQSTISTVEREIVEAGGRATAIPVDVRDFASVQALVDRTIEIYTRLDVLIYNAGAIWWSAVESTPMKRFQLLQRVNPEGLYASVQACLPHLKKSSSSNDGSGRIVVVSPPIYSRFVRGKTAYAMGKIGMSVLTLGLAMDFERQGITDRMAVTSLWPAVGIESAATLSPTTHDPSVAASLRKPTIFSAAILAILRAPPASVNGRLLLDEDFLRTDVGGGVQDFSKYSVVPGSSPRRIMPAVLPDLTVAEQDDEGVRMDSAVKDKRTVGAKL